MALTMLGFEGNFLVSSQLYFHGYEHDPYRLQNQASSLITGIEQICKNSPTSLRAILCDNAISDARKENCIIYSVYRDQIPL
ncbi:hypothetical protein, partial [Candidatus Fukatsuia symbiotica]|uniref:hypothetical protein n=1 Tax=Candidatus Fukatsuia symbiotica TaxID=1878942 RepID=UPI0013C3FB26